MIILGLTGSIGMGKTTAAAMFRAEGVPVHDADAAVHRLIGPGGSAVAAVADAFPGVETQDGIDRARLGKAVFGDDAALARLEAILHPMVRRSERAFLRRHSARRRRLVVLDIPLLFETGAERRCDRVAVVSAPAYVQAQRVLSRPGMTRDKFAAILARQVPDAEKRRLADFVIQSGLGRHHALQQVRRIVMVARKMSPGRWPPGTLGGKRLDGRRASGLRTILGGRPHA